MFYRWHIRASKKGGLCAGKTKRGKGTKIMAIADRSGLPVAMHVASASPHEVKLAEITLERRFVKKIPQRLIGDKACDSDPLDEALSKRGTELIAPYKENRRKPITQDGRSLGRYSRRWKIERRNAWLQNFRRITVRYEYHVLNFFTFVLLGCIVILPRNYLWDEF